PGTPLAFTVLAGWRLRPLGPFHTDDGIATAASEQHAAPAFVQHRQLHLFPGGAELGEGFPKSVFDGFAACFGLVHWLSSILVRAAFGHRPSPVRAAGA